MKPKRLLQAYRGLNRNLRILGTVALLLLGGLAAFIAWRQVGDVINRREREDRRTFNNTYFTGLIASGVTTKDTLLKEVEDILPYASGFIGVSRQKLSWKQAQELADRTGSEVLDLAVTAKDSRRALAGWLANSYPSQHGSTVWVRDAGKAKVGEFPDVLNVTSMDRPRRVLVRWPKNDGWKNLDWSWTIQPQFDEATPFSEWGLARVRVGTLWGLVDESGKMVQEPAFDTMEEFLEQGSARVSKGGKWGLLDRSGKLVAKPEWDDVQHLINGFIPVQRDGRWGYLDASGMLVIPCSWDDAWRFSPEGFAVVTREGKRGFIDQTGRIIVEPMWDGAVNFSKEGFGMVRHRQAWALIDTSGRLLGEAKWSVRWNDRRFDLGFLPVRFGATWSLLGVDGTPLDEAADNYVNPMKPAASGGEPPQLKDFGLSTGRIGQGYRGDYGQTHYHSRHGPAGSSTTIFDKSGGIVIPEVRAKSYGDWGALVDYEWTSDLMPYASPPKYGLIDATGKIVLEPTWDEARILSPELVWIRMGANCGLADKTGKVIIAPAWDELDVLPVDSGSLGEDGKSVLLGRRGSAILSPWVRVKDGDKVKILRLNGEPAIPDTLPDAEYVDFYGPAHVVFKQPDGQGGFVWSVYEPATGDQVKFTEADTFRWNWNMASVGVIWMNDKATGEWRLLRRKGHDFGHRQPEVEKPDGWGFVEGRAILHKPDGWSYVDTEIKPISPDKWEKANDFSEGLAAVSREGKWGFIALDGRTIIPLEWDAVLDFSRGLAAVKKGDRWGYLDLQGKVAIEPVWDDAKSFRQWLGEPAADGQVPFLEVAEVRINGAAAMIDRAGMLLIDPQNPWLARYGAAIVNGKEQLIVMKTGAAIALAKRAWSAGEVAEVSPARGWQVADADAADRKPGAVLVDETRKALTAEQWGSPWYDRIADPLAGGLISARTKDQKYGLIRRDGTVLLAPQFERIAWIAPKVAVVWNNHTGGLIDTTGAWIFKGNDKVRIARFGMKNSRSTESQFRHGLALIEDVPKWGYARLNR